MNTVAVVISGPTTDRVIACRQTSQPIVDLRGGDIANFPSEAFQKFSEVTLHVADVVS